jgi:hypothetical protein
MADQAPWYADLDPDELAELFPNGQADIEAFEARQKWRAQHQGFPRTCTNEAALMDLAKMMLGTS